MQPSGSALVKTRSLYSVDMKIIILCNDLIEKKAWREVESKKKGVMQGQGKKEKQGGENFSWFGPPTAGELNHYSFRVQASPVRSAADTQLFSTVIVVKYLYSQS